MSFLSVLGELLCEAFYIPTSKTPRCPGCGVTKLDVYMHAKDCPERDEDAPLTSAAPRE